MEKYFYLDAEQQNTGASFDDQCTFDLSPGFPPFTDNKPLLPLLFDNFYQASTSLTSHPFPTFNTALISDDFGFKLNSSLDSMANITKVKTPKTEPEETNFVKQFNHIPNQPSLSNLPSLCSLEEHVNIKESKLEAQSLSRPETQSSVQLSSPLPHTATLLKYKQQRELARRRRQRLREKIESLKMLLPMHTKKKMDTSTVLENAGKYIKFLEAQVKVLNAMPVDDCLVTENMSLQKGGGGLDRNKALQIMVNSKLMQEKMSSEGMCVYSVEQLVQMIGRLFNSDEASVLLNSVLFSSFAPL